MRGRIESSLSNRKRTTRGWKSTSTSTCTGIDQPLCRRKFVWRWPPYCGLLFFWMMTQSTTGTIPPVVTASFDDFSYNTATGASPLCWRSIHPIQIGMFSFPSSCENVTLTLHRPTSNEPHSILRTRETYDYPIEIRIPDFEMTPSQVGVKLLFCVVSRVGFCSPFIHDEAMAKDLDYTHTNISSPNTHIESKTIWIDLRNQSTLQINMSIPVSLPEAGDYFPIVALQYSSDVFRWDIANALSPQSRLLTLQDPPIISDVSQGVRIFSYVAIGISAAIILWLLWQTLKYRKEPVLNLSQADFLVVFLLAALLATISSFLWQPHSDLYCQLSSPMILIPVQLMYSITLGRLWRIHAVVSPLLLEQYRKKLRHHMVWRMQLIQCFLLVARIPQQLFRCDRFCTQTFAHSSQPNRRNDNAKALRRSVTSKQLSLVVLFFVFPQIILQTCSLIFQPHSLELVWNDDFSVATPRCTNGQVWYKSLLNYAYAALMILMLTLMVMAFSSRKLPSLFNETTVIYQTAINTLFLVLLGLIVIGVTTRDEANTSDVGNPDIQYLVWLTVLLSITLGSSMRLMIPKLKMVWRGETVVVSKLVSDHHHRLRKSDKASSMTASSAHLMHNVTGLYQETEDSRPRPSSQQNSSYRSVDTNASSDFFEALTPLTSDETIKTMAIAPVLTMPPPFMDDEGPGGNNVAEETNGESTALETTKNTGKSVEINNNNNNNKNVDLKAYSFSHFFDMQELKPRKYFSRQRTSRDVLTAAAANVDQRKLFLRKRSSRNGFTLPKIVVSPEETPPRRLVLKMVDLQEELASLNKNIMSGLAVKPESWDAVVDLVTRIEKNFREDVVFSWRPQPNAPLTSTPESQSTSTPMALASLQEVEEEDSEHLPVDSETPLAPTTPGSNASGQPGKRASLHRLENEFKRIVDVRDRKYKLIMYENVFIGTEAVDTMLYNGLATSRAEAVALGRRLANDRRLFQHVTNEYDFEDKPHLYRYLDHEEESLSSLDEEDDLSIEEPDLQDTLDQAIMKEQALRFIEVVKVGDRKYYRKQYPSVFVGSEAVDALVYNGVAATRWEAVQLGRKLCRELKLFQHVNDKYELRDEFLLYQFQDAVVDQLTSNTARVPEVGTVTSRPARQRKSPLAEKADAFRMYVDIRDRRIRMQNCKKTFVGHEAVDAVIYAGLAKTREEAVQLGITIQRELRLFQCVSGEKLFEDGIVFYRFRDSVPSLKSTRDVVSLQSVAPSVEHNSASLHVDDSEERLTANLLEQVQLFKHIVPVSDRTHHFRKYTNVFVGCEAIDSMIFYGMAHSRDEAVQLGRMLAREVGLFQHVSDDHRYAFCDDFLLYRYADNNGFLDNILEQESVSTRSLKMDKSGFAQFGLQSRGELGVKAELFRACVDVRDRTYRMVKHKSCFIGTEAVDAMLFAGVVDSRENAVEVGRALATQLRLFRPCSVATRSPFDDAHVFYRFDERYQDLNHNSLNDLSQEHSTGGDTVLSRERLSHMVDLFRGCVVLKDRKYRFRTYRQCFVGAETVSALVDSRVVETRKDAVEFGRTLARELHLFQSVIGDYAFSDDAILYSFVRDGGMNASAEYSDQSFSSFNSRSVPGESGDLPIVNENEEINGDMNLPILFEGQPLENNNDTLLSPNHFGTNPTLSFESPV